MSETTRMIVLCTGNRCRSQMAEGWLRHFAQSQGTTLDIHSAGTNPKGVHPLAIRVMAQAGVDISQHKSQHVDAFAGQEFNVVVTVCGRANEACPAWLGNAGMMIHEPFDDPDIPGLAEAELLSVFNRVRDQIRDWAQHFVGLLAQGDLVFS